VLVERTDEALLRCGASVAVDKLGAEERQDEGGVVCPQEPPRRVRSRSISIASNSIDLLLVPDRVGAGTDRNGIDTGLWAIRGPGSGDPEIRPGWPSAEMMSVGS